MESSTPLTTVVASTPSTIILVRSTTYQPWCEGFPNVCPRCGDKDMTRPILGPRGHFYPMLAEIPQWVKKQYTLCAKCKPVN